MREPNTPNTQLNNVINIFQEMANIHNILGNTFQAYAYLNAIIKLKSAKTINLADFTTKMQEKIKEIIKTGKLNELDKLLDTPKIRLMEELIKIKGFGDRFIVKIIAKYNINTIDDFYNLIKSDQIKLTHQQQIGLKYYYDLLKKIPRTEVKKTYDIILDTIPDDINDNNDFYLVGSYRREKPESKDIDIIMVRHKKNQKDLMKLISYLEDNKIILDHFAKGNTRFSGIIKTKANKYVRQVDILYVDKENLYPALLHSTGSGIFNKNMRLIAIKKGMKLSEKGLFKGSKKIKVNSEKDIFAALEIPYVSPRNR